MTDIKNNESTGGYVPGELVDVTIRGARVSVDRGGFLLIDVGSQPWRTHINLKAPGVQVIRVSPPEWPPQPGDVWFDQTGHAWMVCGDGYGGVEMSGAAGGGRWSQPAEVFASFGPMRLEYRPNWKPPALTVTMDNREATFTSVVDEPTALLPVVPLPGVGAQPVDEQVTEDDGRCWATIDDTTSHSPGAQHYCELYGEHIGIAHICVCGHTWANDVPGVDTVLPAPRPAGE